MEKIKLNLERPIAFYPQLSRVLGGIDEAIFVQQLYYWSDKGRDKEGWIYKTKKEWEEETTLTPKMQDRVRKSLVKTGVLITELKAVGNKPILHYKLDIAMIQKVIMQYDERYDCNDTKGNIPSYTEITSENTTDTATQALQERVDINKLIELFKEVNPSFTRLFKMPPQREAIKRMVSQFGEEQLIAMINALPQVNKIPFMPVTTTPYELEKNMGKIKAKVEQERIREKGRGIRVSGL